MFAFAAQTVTAVRRTTTLVYKDAAGNSYTVTEVVEAVSCTRVAGVVVEDAPVEYTTDDPDVVVLVPAAARLPSLPARVLLTVDAE